MKTTETRNLIRAIDRFEKYFGSATEDERRKIEGILRIFMTEIREVLDESMTLTRIISPEMEKRCATCAFNPATDGLRGFHATAYGLLHVMVTDKVFLCHGENPNWKDQHLIDPLNPVLCNGFGAVRMYSASKSTVTASRAMRAIREVFPGKK